MRRRKFVAALAAGALAVTAAACGSSSSSSSSSSTPTASSAATGTSTVQAASTLNGAGSTFAQPLYNKWAGDFASTNHVQVNYQGVGSGAGIQQFTAKTVDFGGTDAPMKDTEIATAQAAGGDVLHVPTALGAVVVIYNLPGVSGLKLDGATLANIYLGNVKTWNDPAIAALNPAVTLPSTAITPVHRADSSGTTFTFSGYLADVSPDFKTKIGQSKTPMWPGGVGAPKNDGVAASVKQTNGAVGYVELQYALKNSLSYTQVKNASGAYVQPNLASVTAAASGKTYPADLRFSLLNSSNPAAYPIVSATWILTWKTPSKAGQSAATAQAVVAWLNYALGPGQATESSLGYAPLPPDLLSLAKAAAAQITVP